MAMAMANGEASTPLLPRHAHRNHQAKIFAAVASAAALMVTVAAIMSLSGSRSIGLKSLDREIQVENQRLSAIEAQNQRLEREANRYSEVKRLKAVAAKEREVQEKEKILKAQNIKLKLEKAEIQHQILMQRLAKDQKEAMKAKHYSRPSVRAISGTKPRQLSVLATSRNAGKQRGIKRETEQLVGEYVKTCNDWGCKVVYKPEENDLNMTFYAGHDRKTGKAWPGNNDAQLVTGNHLLWPLGPVMRQNLTRYQAPLHDIVPKKSKLGDNWVGFGHGDSFVKVENSALGPYGSLPPWKKGPLKNFNNYNYTYKPFGFLSTFEPSSADPDALEEANATHWECPGDPTGRSCISGSSGVDGVYESSPLSPNFYDPNKVLMEKHGVAIDSWPWYYPGSDAKHEWGQDAKDHYNSEKSAKFFDYDKAERPDWDYDNHALRSLPDYADPDGPANKQLMLGRFWNNTHEGLPTMEDDWVHNESIAVQLEPPHSETREDDHFSNWTHYSDENIKLLYGESRVFNGLLRKKDAEYEVDPWSLGDVPLPIGEYKDLVGADSLERTGEPFGDLQHGWSGQNMVAASSANLRAAAPEAVPAKAVGPSPGRLALEKKGVNVGGEW